MQKQNLNEKSDDFGCCHNSHSDSRGPVARLRCKSGSPRLHWSPKCNAVSFSPIGTGKENGHIITEKPHQNVLDYWASRPNIEPPNKWHAAGLRMQKFEQSLEHCKNSKHSQIWGKRMSKNASALSGNSNNHPRHKYKTTHHYAIV